MPELWTRCQRVFAASNRQGDAAVGSLMDQPKIIRPRLNSARRRRRMIRNRRKSCGRMRPPPLAAIEAALAECWTVMQRPPAYSAMRSAAGAPITGAGGKKVELVPRRCG